MEKLTLDGANSRKLRPGRQVLLSMALEYGIYGDSIKANGQWLKKNQLVTGLARQMRRTHSAITLVKVSMANILLDLNRSQSDGNQGSMKDTGLSRANQKMKLLHQFMKNKTKQQWFSKTMRLHLIELRAHAPTLHLILGVLDL